MVSSPIMSQGVLAGVRVVLAEDAVANQRLLTFYLERAGAAVVAVADGAELVTTLAAGLEPGAQLVDPSPADLIVTDIEMPGLDGYSASRLLRSLGCAVPIVALTAHSGLDVEARCREAGCDAFATKPIDHETLLAVCVQALSRLEAPAKQGNQSTDRPVSAAPASVAPMSATDADASPSQPSLRSQFADDPEMQELVAAFTATLAHRAAAVLAELEAERIDELARLAHQLKGIGGSYGFPSITEAARDVDYRARNGSDAAGIRGSVQRLVKLCRAAATPAQAAAPAAAATPAQAAAAVPAAPAAASNAARSI